MEENKELEIHMGGLAPKFAKQIKDQGYAFDTDVIESFQKNYISLMQLRFADLLTDKIYDHIRGKLFKKIIAHVKIKNKVKKA